MQSKIKKINADIPGDDSWYTVKDGEISLTKTVDNKDPEKEKDGVESIPPLFERNQTFSRMYIHENTASI